MQHDGATTATAVAVMEERVGVARGAEGVLAPRQAPERVVPICERQNAITAKSVGQTAKSMFVPQPVFAGGQVPGCCRRTQVVQTHEDLLRERPTGKPLLVFVVVDVDFRPGPVDERRIGSNDRALGLLLVGADEHGESPVSQTCELDVDHRCTQ